jgi:hypothetical protein
VPLHCLLNVRSWVFVFVVVALSFPSPGSALLDIAISPFGQRTASFPFITPFLCSHVSRHISPAYSQ